MKTIEKILLDFDPEEKNLLKVLREVSAGFGYVNKEQAQKISQYFSCPLSKVFETGSFYSDINFEKPPQILIEVCSCPSCVMKGSIDLISEIENYFKIKIGEKNSSKVWLLSVSCLGMCDESPVLRINGEKYSQVEKSKLYQILEKYI